MAAITISWDPTAPADGDTLTSGNEAIQAVKTGASQRLRNGGHSWDATAGATTTETDGRHSCGMAFATGSAIELAGEFTIFATDKATPLVIFRDAAAATPSEVFLGANGLRTTGTIQGATINAVTLVKPTTDGAVDLGVDTTGRWRDLWIGRNARVNGTLRVVGVATFDAVPVFSAGSTFSTLNVTSLFSLSGGFQSAITTVTTGSYTVQLTDRVILCTVVGATTINLPSCASMSGRDLIITIPGQAGSGFGVSIDPFLTEKIDNSALAYTLARASSGNRCGAHIFSDGTQWTILSVYLLP